MQGSDLGFHSCQFIEFCDGQAPHACSMSAYSTKMAWPLQEEVCGAYKIAWAKFEAPAQR